MIRKLFHSMMSRLSKVTAPSLIGRAGGESAILLFILLLASCSSDQEEWKGEATIEAMISAQSFEDVTKVTRSWNPPTSYYLYNTLYESGAYFKPLTNSAIDVFFATATDATLHGSLRYSSNTTTWRFVPPKSINPENISSGDYFAYGYLPREAADGATLSMLPGASSYEQGAVLTIQGLETVATDGCVIIGAKEGNTVYTAGYSGSYDDIDENNGYNSGDIRTDHVRAGDFGFRLNTGEHAKNYLYFLFDHLCSALFISMRVDGTYNALRTIRLKELHLRTRSASGVTKKKMDVTIKLEKNNDGSNPITEINFTPTGDEESYGTVYENAEGLTLTTDYSIFIGHFFPQGVTEVDLISTYDVYDKDTSKNPMGNLIREDCMATNTIVLTELFPTMGSARRGWKYNLNLTIQPTYLYMMSDPDLDNPTLVIN